MALPLGKNQSTDPPEWQEISCYKYASLPARLILQRHPCSMLALELLLQSLLKSLFSQIFQKTKISNNNKTHSLITLSQTTFSILDKPQGRLKAAYD
jgi:hypothetical protein